MDSYQAAVMFVFRSIAITTQFGQNISGSKQSLRKSIPGVSWKRKPSTPFQKIDKSTGDIS